MHSPATPAAAADEADCLAGLRARQAASRPAELPLTATGKVKKHILAELLEPAAS